MNARAITARLVRLVGESAAYELLETPNADLDGMSPQDLLDGGTIAPVLTLLERMEQAASFIERPPALRSKREADRLLSILDEIQVEQLRSMNFEEEAAR